MTDESSSDSFTDYSRITYKSKGERQIADMLQRYRLDFVYEPGLLIYDRDPHQPRIWYPDFGLPQYSVYIEYFGVEGDSQYDARTRYKLDAYARQQIAVVPVYPATLRGDYDQKIIGGVRQYTANRLGDLEHRLAQAPRPRPNRGCYGRRRSY
jgi:hypothetical protein